MIDRVRFKNFKSLRDVYVDLAPFTLIVGANGSGKSSVLQGIQRLLFVARDPASKPKQGLALVFETNSKGGPALVFEGAFAPDRVAAPSSEGFFELECSGAPFGTFGVRAFVAPEAPNGFELWGGGESKTLALDHAGKSQPRAARADFVDPFFTMGLGDVAYLNLDAKNAAEPHYSDEEEAHLAFDGTGLPSVLQRLQLIRDGRFERIEEGLRRVVPSVRRIRALPHKVVRTEQARVVLDTQEHWVDQQRERIGARIEADVVGAGWIAADLLSEGTILTLALLTVLHDEAPRTLLLDDLDQALHPTAQGRLMKEIRALQQECPNVQIVATTHSPFLVDHAAVEEVRVIRLDDQGASHCQPLAAHPKWAKRSGFMKPGEFWAGVGEDWVGL